MRVDHRSAANVIGIGAVECGRDEGVGRKSIVPVENSLPGIDRIGAQVVGAGPGEGGGGQAEVLLRIRGVEDAVRAADGPPVQRLPGEADAGAEILPVDLAEVRLAGANGAAAAEYIRAIQSAQRVRLRRTPRRDAVE